MSNLMLYTMHELLNQNVSFCFFFSVISKKQSKLIVFCIQSRGNKANNLHKHEHTPLIAMLSSFRYCQILKVIHHEINRKKIRTNKSYVHG